MGKLRSSDTRLFVDYHDLSGDLNASTQTIEQPAIDVRCYPDRGPVDLVDYYRTRDEWNGFFNKGNMTPQVIDRILNDLVGSTADHYLLKLYQGNSENALAYEMIERLTAQPLTSRDGQAIMLSASFDGSGACYRGRVLRSATVTGTGNGTGRNLGATLATDTFAVTMRVIGGTFASIGLKIQSSTDDGGGDPYADVATMAHTFTAPGAVRLTKTGVTEAWKRATISAFTGTNAIILVTGGKLVPFV